MADINDVLERLITDPGFRQQLHEDHAKALDGYDLTADDHELLAAQLSEGGGDRQVEQRTSKSAFAGLLGGLADAAGSAGETQESLTGAPTEPSAQQQETNHAFVHRLADDEPSESEQAGADLDGADAGQESDDKWFVADSFSFGTESSAGSAAEVGADSQDPAPGDEHGRYKVQLPFDHATGDDLDGSDAGQQDHDDWIDAQAYGNDSAGLGGDDPFSFSGSSADMEGATASPVPEEIPAEGDATGEADAMTEEVVLSYEEIPVEQGAGDDSPEAAAEGDSEDSSKPGGNVEFVWKVEEGESAPPPEPAPDVAAESEVQEGHVEVQWKVEEGESASPPVPNPYPDVAAVSEVQEGIEGTDVSTGSYVGDDLPDDSSDSDDSDAG